MKITILYISLFAIIACNGAGGLKDYAGATSNIADAKQKKLLKNEYIPDKRKVFINNEEYEILEAWSSDRFITVKNKNKNELIYDFLISVKNVKTNERFLSFDTESHYSNYIKTYFEKWKYSGFGIETNKIRISLYKKKVPNEIDVIKMGFISNNKEVIVDFNKKI
jgi:hypothetical protein